MKYKYKIPIFPEKGIIFLDTSSFGIDDYDGVFKNESYSSITRLKIETSRLIKFKEILLQKNNWIIIKEVLNEFLDGNSGLEKEARNTRINQRKSAFKRLIRQRKNILKLFIDHQIISVPGFSIENIIGANFNYIEKIFTQKGGTTNKEKTDIKLIATALNHAKMDFSYIFSQDQDLLRTYATCSKKFFLLDKTYVMSDRFRKPIPAKSYLD